MKHLITTTIILVIQTLSTFGQDCQKLDDGRYYFKYKEKSFRKSDFILTIEGDFYFLTRNGHEYPKGTIEWWPDKCMFRLSSEKDLITEQEKKIDSLDHLQKKDTRKIQPVSTNPVDLLEKTHVSWGGYCYELTDKRKFRLTYCGNLHITPAEGRIIKK